MQSTPEDELQAMLLLLRLAATNGDLHRKCSSGVSQPRTSAAASEHLNWTELQSNRPWSFKSRARLRAGRT
jgi:hypothetical protein